MYHSITFGNKNTYKDWHLVPESRPSIVMPKPKRVTVDIPGRDGVLDLSEAIRKFPVYENRSGTLTFHVLNGYQNWQVLYSTIANYLHGRDIQVKLEDDPNWYYTGRVWVNSWTSNNDGTWSDIEFEYDLSPYKLYVYTTLSGDWIWDTFSFVNGRIIGTTMKDVNVDSTSYKTLNLLGFVGTMPICPKFIVSSSGGIDFHIYNQELGINITKTGVKTGTYTWPEVMLTERSDSNNVYVQYKKSSSYSSTSKFSIEYRMGSL